MNFDQSPADFGNDPAVQSFIAAAKGACPALIDAQQARDHLQATLDYMAANNGLPNSLPTAAAGADRSVNANTAVVLNGGASNDPEDGTNLTFNWAQQSGPAVLLAGADAATASFTSPVVDEDTDLVFRLTVTDSAGARHADDVVVTVRVEAQENQPPVADAGHDNTVNEGDSVTLDGSASRDPEDGENLEYQWTQTSGPAVTLDETSSATPSFVAPMVDQDTVLSFQLVVTDSQGLASGPSSVNIDVLNVEPGVQPPSADAGPDQDVDENSDVILDGSNSADPQQLPLTYRWRQIGGLPAVTLDGADSAIASFTAPDVAGDQVLLFQLTVTNSGNAVDTDTIGVTVRDNTVVAVSSAQQAEGNEGTVPMAFTVTLSAPQAVSVSLNYKTRDDSAGSLAPDADYLLSAGRLSFAPGETEKTITVQVIGDRLAENDETFFVDIANVKGAAVGQSTATGTIIDDDDGPLFVGAARQIITPAQAHIDGIDEPRLGGSSHLQKFNLGGFGIDPTQNFPDPIGGFGDELTTPAGSRVYKNSRKEEEHTWIRAMVIAERQPDNTDKQIAFVILDAIGAGNVISNNLKAAVSAATGIAPDDILFGQTHSHAGADLQGLWGGVPQDWIENVLYPAAVAAVREAQRNRCRAELTVAQGEERDLNRYRRPRVDENAEADPTMTLLRAHCVAGPDAGQLKGTLLQFNAHPVGIGARENPRVPHADYILGAVEWLEEDGGVALYYNGPIADASISGGGRPGCNPEPDGDFSTVRCRGEHIAERALGFGEPRSLESKLESRHETVVLPVTNPAFLAAGALGSFNRYYDFLMLPTADIPFLGPEFQYLPQVTPTAETPVSRITIGGAGGLEIVTIPGEATNTFGQYIRSLAAEANPGAEVMLMGLTQQSFGYIIPEDEFSYIEPAGGARFADIPFTNYEEFVSLGPLTAPLLRLQGYNPLFGIAPENPDNLPPWLSACENSQDPACIVSEVGRRLDYIQRSYAEACLNAGLPEPFCALLNPDTPLAQQCYDQGLPENICAVFGPPGDGNGGDAAPDQELVDASAAAQIQGCDILDTAHCLFPFPSNHFTAPAAAGSPQSEDRGGTGLRINFNPLAMPRNAAGKPIDPTEWNRNDGFSPGQMVLTYVPGIATVKGQDGKPVGPIEGVVPITRLPDYQDSDAPIVVINTETGERHPIWAEIDLNAGIFIPARPDIPSPPTKGNTRPALIIRPAQNFEEGTRYIVALRNLRNDSGEILPAGPAFRVCRDNLDTQLPQVAARCEQLEDNVFTKLPSDIVRGELYLAWDFTVASQQSLAGRLLHIRDHAFASLGETIDILPGEPGYDIGSAPTVTVDSTVLNPRGNIARRIEGTITVPSYVTPSEPSPLEASEYETLFAQLRDNHPEVLDAIHEQCKAFAPQGEICLAFDPDTIELGRAVSAPPNRFFYNPTDDTAHQSPYGDGLPDRIPGMGSMTRKYICNIPNSASAETPARPSLYGHGLLGSRTEVNSSHVADMADAHNMMFCAVDWFGFSEGDLPNIATILLDVSNLPLLADGAQQGMLNMMFLARAMKHPEGFAAHPAFQDGGGKPLFDNSEIYYDGNSQGGIMGGPVVAVSRDVNRGVLGVPGMNYSTLLRRSVDFDLYSIPLNAAYHDDLDRSLVFSMMEMLWERAENNGYAHHMGTGSSDNRPYPNTPDNEILLQVGYSDHQVTMWSADVMARTIHAGVDRQDLTSPDRHPDEQEYALLDDLTVAGGSQYSDGRYHGSGLIIFDEPWDASPDGRCAGNSTLPAPIGNVPPRTPDPMPEGLRNDDPHECPRREPSAKCQKSHFLHPVSAVLDVNGISSDGLCPELPALPDRDGDGVPDRDDAFPDDPNESVDTDGDGTGDNADTDRDGDGIDNDTDNCPEVANPDQADTDGNGAGDACDPPDDSDDDGIPDVLDRCPDTAPGSDVNAEGCSAAQLTNASCSQGTKLSGGDSYQVLLTSNSGKRISFQVLEPAEFDCANIANGAHPLILQGHGFGGSRSTSGFDNYREAGYAVISIDQRGFGESNGTVRVMDPDFEGKDLIDILDWAEQNLDYLAYRDEANGEFVPRPSGGASISGGVNLLAGAIGGSYGGGYQFLLHNVDPLDRLDALAPDITWHDLRYSLNPGDTLKSAFGLLLSAGGTEGSYSPGLENQDSPTDRGLDPFIVETLAKSLATGEFPREALEWFRYHSPSYWCGLNGQPNMPYEAAEWLVDPNTTLTAALTETSEPGSNTRSGQRPASVLITQGFRDTLFNFNDAWWNYQCARVRGGDVRLLTHQSGHILNPADLVGAPEGTPLDVQAPGESRNCGAINSDTATLQWFDEQLRRGNATALDGTDNLKLCLSLAENDAILVPEKNVLAPRAEAEGFPIGISSYYPANGFGVSNVPQGVLAQTLHLADQLTPSVVPLLTVTDSNGLIVAGIPQGDITVSTPGDANDAACEGGSSVPTLRTGCDSVVFVGLGYKRGDTSWVLIDDQLTPVRGLGAHTDVEMTGIAERLLPGDQLGLMVYGYHLQYLGSFSRDPSIAAVNLRADLQLPLYAVASDGVTPDFIADPAQSLAPTYTGGSVCTDPTAGPDIACFADGTAVNVVRQLCDYQWLPGVCEEVEQPEPQYLSNDDPSPDEDYFLTIGAVHEHSSYSDGDPEAIPHDYFAAGRYGHNNVGVDAEDRGITLDFMMSSEHSDNEKLPITTSADCIYFNKNIGSNDPQEYLPSSPDDLLKTLDCDHSRDPHHYFKWLATLEQARHATETAGTGNNVVYTGFTGMRGFEWTNDYYNHINVYFSTNVVNVKVDGSYTSMEFFWKWLRKPVDQGGGADALVTFNHPGGDPKLSPFDGGLPHGGLMQQTLGGANWNDLEYAPNMDGSVIGIEVNGDRHLPWYIKALNRGWHLGPVAAEDEHSRDWASSEQGKTVILTRGRSPRDYYFAMKNRRTMALSSELIAGTPGTKAQFPQIHFFANGSGVQDGIPLGSIVEKVGEHMLHISASGLPNNAAVALISNTTDGQTAPIQLGVAAGGALNVTHTVTTPAFGEDWYFVIICPADTVSCGTGNAHLAVTAPIWFAASTTGSVDIDYGEGVIGAIAEFGHDFNEALTTLLSGDFTLAQTGFQSAFTNLSNNLLALGGEDPSDISPLIGLHDNPDEVITELTTAHRRSEPVIVTGDKIVGWSVPAAYGLPYPYPSGVGGDGEAFIAPIDSSQDAVTLGVRDAHNGILLYPAPGEFAQPGVDIGAIAAYRYEPDATEADANGFVEIPLQVDEKMPYFLANSNSDFSFYSGTDEELSYAWDTEAWGMTQGVCQKEYDSGQSDSPAPGIIRATPDPVPGLDFDDEIVFMASDAGSRGPDVEPNLPVLPVDTTAAVLLTVIDPLAPDAIKYVYLVQKAGSSSVNAANGYVSYQRDADADQWIDRSFFADSDPEKLGTSNTGYGPNLSGPVCPPGENPRQSDDRFPRDGVTVTTDNYQWYASGRWMVRSLKVRPTTEDPVDWEDRLDLIDRWKGRAFQQSPDSTVSLVGFEDEQVNWEANSTLLGERCGPVRCIREVWGADSGTNVTKTETFYRDAITYRYRVRVHPIPPDGLYTSWDYNRGAMLPTAEEANDDVQAGRYYTALRPQGVAIDGINDDFGQVDSIAGSPMFFDAADPTFNLPLAFDNWEQVSGKGDSGSLVYSFEIKGVTSLATPVVVPYYRDDACLDDGTGDDPVPRPWPGEASTDSRVVGGYMDLNGDGEVRCEHGEMQGAYAAHGVHYFFTGDVDNAFVLGKPLNEIDGQQWQFIVPTAQPINVGAPYANIVRAPLQVVATPITAP